MLNDDPAEVRALEGWLSLCGGARRPLRGSGDELRVSLSGAPESGRAGDPLLRALARCRLLDAGLELVEGDTSIRVRIHHDPEATRRLVETALASVVEPALLTFELRPAAALA
jgi:hypothetical protein